MNDKFKTENNELESLFQRYEKTPDGHVFAPLADACRKAGMLEEAIEICEKGVSKHPRYASGFVVRGKCYYDIGNADQAEASFEKVLELDVNNLVALKFMGMILAERGLATEARARFEHILALDPDNKEIAEKLGDLGEDASHESFVEDLAEVLGADETPEALVIEDSATDDVGEDEPIELRAVDDETFAGAKISLGDTEPTPDALATLTLAEIYASQGYRRKAIKIYKELLETEPENEFVRAKLEELGKARKSEAETVTVEDAAPDPAQVNGVATEDVPAEETVEAEVVAETAPEPEPVVKPEAVEPPGKAPPGPAEGSQPIEAARSADQFKRWLENMNQ
jgi:tetratricopeptide (TPR) repeat protein